MTETLPIGRLLTTSEAATAAMVSVEVVRKWMHRGHLPVAERDERGRPLYRWIDVVKAEHRTRERARRVYHVLPLDLVA